MAVDHDQRQLDWIEKPRHCSVTNQPEVCLPVYLAAACVGACVSACLSICLAAWLSACVSG